MTSTPIGKRLDHLDGLRALAVAMVLIFHYTVRWAQPRSAATLYPWGSEFVAVPGLQFGAYGVQLFFMISGFVISMTLVRCADRIEFAVRRFARLWPALVIAVGLTLLVTRLVPQGEVFRQGVSSLVPSLTLVPPVLWHRVGVPVAGYADGVLWSLWVEVLFYAVAAVLFFWFRERFLPALFGFAVLLTATTFGVSLAADHAGSGWLSAVADKLSWGLSAFPLNKHVWWFVFGAAMWEIWRGGDRKSAWWTAGVAVLAQEWVSNSLAPWSNGHGSSGWPLAVAVASLFALFLAALHIRPLQRVLGLAALALVGRASYCVYLLHQVVGLTILRLIADALDMQGLSSVALAPVSVALVLGVSIAVYRLWEVPLQSRTLRLFRARRAAVDSRVSV